MMASLPVIASKTGSLSEIVINRKTGFILEENTPEEICKKVLILRDKKFREKMGNAGRKIFLENFEEKKYKQKFLKLIKEVSNI